MSSDEYFTRCSSLIAHNLFREVFKMETLQLNVKKRKEHGKSDARRLRRDGFLPAILYGGEDNIPLIINAREFAKILDTMR